MMLKIPRFTLPLMLALATLAAPLTSVAKPENGQTFNDWRAKCETPKNGGDEICHVFQNLVVKDTQKLLMAVMVVYPPKRTQPVMIFTLPLGVALIPGLEISVDAGKPVHATFETCLHIGCRAGLLLDDDFLKAMKAGNKLSVKVTDLKGETANLPVSLNGFTAALGSLK